MWFDSAYCFAEVYMTMEISLMHRDDWQAAQSPMAVTTANCTHVVCLLRRHIMSDDDVLTILLFTAQVR